MAYSAATEVTKQNILDAFWQLYCREKGLKGVTVKEIVATAGYTRPTFYDYFLSVEDALRQLEEGIIPTDALLRLQLRLLTTDVTAGELLSALDELFAPDYPKIAVLLGEYGDPTFAPLLAEALLPCVKAWFQRGRMLPQEAEEPLAQFLIGGMGRMFTHCYDPDGTSPLKRLGGWIGGVPINA